MDASSTLRLVSPLTRGGLLAVVGAALVLLVAGICRLASFLRRRRALSGFPLQGAEYGSFPARERAFRAHAREIYLDGYRRFRNVAHRLTTADGEKLVLPVEYLDELRKRPDEEVNSWKPLATALESRYTQVMTHENDSFVARMVRSDLTRNLSRINPVVSDEVNQTVKRLIPPTEEWSSVALEKRLLELVAVVSGRVFIGPELCRREEWLDASINFTVNLFSAVRALKRWPLWIRPLGGLLTPELRRLRRHRADARRFLRPVIRDRRRRMAAGEPVPEDDMLQWMLAKGGAEGIDDDDMAINQLGLSMAAIHTTTRTLTHVLFDLVAHPDVVPELRREIETVLARHGGVMTTQALFQMKLLDSAMKESHRVNPTGMERFVRRIDRDIVLSDGTRLPAGATIGTPYLAIMNDPALFPNADTYDPYRFYRLRTGEEGKGEQEEQGCGGADDDAAAKRSLAATARANREQFQFVSITESDLTFGYGRHACPGRFFAANEIKLILARILLDYDISLPEGVNGRYPNVPVGAAGTIPQPGAIVRFRRARRAPGPEEA